MQLRKKTNFKTDVEIYGPIGEISLKERLTEKGKLFLDTSNNPNFKMFDIDIIQISDNNIDDIKCLNCLRTGLPLSNINAIGYEVKTDTVGFKSRNLVFELFSNSNPGCLARSAADYLYYVFLDENNKILEEYLLKMKTLRYWLMCHFWEVNQVEYLKSKSMRRNQDNTGILLVNVDKLLEEKICVKLNALS